MSKSSVKKLYKSKDDKIVAGIFGGLGKYLDVDANFLRIVGFAIFVLTAIFPFLLVYLVAVFIIPAEEEK